MVRVKKGGLVVDWLFLVSVYGVGCGRCRFGVV